MRYDLQTATIPSRNGAQRNRRRRKPIPSGTRWLQKALNKVLDLRLVVDGIEGPQTRSAIRKFQASAGLAVDGVASAKTRRALGRSLRTKGQRGEDTAPPNGSSEDLLPGSGPTVHLDSGVVVSDHAVSTLKRILAAAGLASAGISSGRRSSADQARVMYNLIERNSVDYAKNLYGSSGDKVIDVYVAGKQSGHGADAIKQSMQDKVVELGPSNVSRHASDSFDVMDVKPSTITNKPAFEAALEAALADRSIDTVIGPPGDPAYHIEIRLSA